MLTQWQSKGMQEQHRKIKPKVGGSSPPHRANPLPLGLVVRVHPTPLESKNSTKGETISG